MFQTSEAQLTFRHGVKEKINRYIFLPKLPLQCLPRRGEAFSVADGLFWRRLAGGLLLGGILKTPGQEVGFASSYSCHFLGFCQGDPFSKGTNSWGVRKGRATLRSVLGRKLDSARCPKCEDPSKAKGPLGVSVVLLGEFHKQWPPFLMRTPGQTKVGVYPVHPGEPASYLLDPLMTHG